MRHISTNLTGSAEHFNWVIAFEIRGVQRYFFSLNVPVAGIASVARIDPTGASLKQTEERDRHHNDLHFEMRKCLQLISGKCRCVNVSMGFVFFLISLSKTHNLDFN